MPSFPRVIAAAAAITLTPFALAPSTAQASTADDRPFPTRIFAAGSPFYQRLPDGTPTAPDSDGIVADLVQESHDFYGSWNRRNVDISTGRWTPTMWVARSSDPVAQLRTDNCQGKPWGWDRDLVNDHFAGVRIPADAVADDSGDGSMVVYNPDEDTVTETWVTRKQGDGSFTACFGGTIRNASAQVGQHRGFYGVSGSGLAMAGFVIRPHELRAGRIDHVIALNVPHTKAGVHSWPATRNDGWVWGTAVAEGQILRLPASLDIDALHLSPTARTIAKAAQEYGIMVTDTGGAVTFIAQNSRGMAGDPYPALFRGRSAAEEMNGDPARGEQPFPLDKLVALPIDYRVEGAPQPAPQPTPRRDGPKVVIRQSADQDGPVTDHEGNVWAARADSTFEGGHTSSRHQWAHTAGTQDQDLFAKGVWGLRRYGVDVPNGTYDVTLEMSEDFWNEPGRRVFDVAAEGRTVLQDVDVFAAAGGKYRAYERTVTVDVNDGHLDLSWTAKRDFALVNAIRVAQR